MISEIKELIEGNQELLKNYQSFIASDTFKSYEFDSSEITKIKIDLSFFNVSILGENNVVDFVKNQIKLNPEITPLMHVLKRYLSLNRLNSCFNGGLSSYSLLLMIIAYSRYPKTSNITNLGALLTGFLEFYGKYFNFNQFVIDISNFK
jgi:DNA polymerase sigma